MNIFVSIIIKQTIALSKVIIKKDCWVLLAPKWRSWFLFVEYNKRPCIFEHILPLMFSPNIYTLKQIKEITVCGNFVNKLNACLQNQASFKASRNFQNFNKRSSTDIRLVSMKVSHLYHNQFWRRYMDKMLWKIY